MRVLITGGAGFIGRVLAARLIGAGHDVAILDSFHPQVHGNVPPVLPEGCEVIRGDVREESAVARGVRGRDIVYHLAAETGVGQSQYEISRYTSVNVSGTASLLEGAAEAGVQQVVLASSRAVYGEGKYRCSQCDLGFVPNPRSTAALQCGLWELACPGCGSAAVPEPTPESALPSPSSIYGLTKLQQEQLAAMVGNARGLGVTTLRFFNVYGAGQSLCNPYVGVLGVFYRRASSGQAAEVYEDGRMLRDFIEVSDVAEALLRCAGNPRAFGATLNIGTGTPVTLKELAEEVYRVCGLEPNIKVSGRYRLGDVRHTLADVERAKDVLAFQASVSLASGLRRFVEWAAVNSDTKCDDATAEAQLASRGLLAQAL